MDVILGDAKQVQPQLQRECRLLVSKGEEKQISTRLSLAENVEAPVDEGQILGELQVYVGDELRDTVPILAAHGVDRLSVPGIFSQLLSQLFMGN